jgi:hypothetical protein
LTSDLRTIRGITDIFVIINRRFSFLGNWRVIRTLINIIEKRVINVARYFYYEIIYVDGEVDDIINNVRKGLILIKANNTFRISSAISKTESKMLPPNISGVSIGNLPRSMSRSIVRKRLFNSLNGLLPSNKRICSSSLYKQGVSLDKFNRVYRRVILRDYGKNIYKISSRVAIFGVLEGIITGKRRK